jgi:hypothetical protein
MSKKRRTKKEKLIAGSRRVITQNSSGAYSLSSEDQIASNITQIKPIRNSSSAYSYVIADSQKTVFIVSLLIAINLLLSFLLQKQLLRFPFFGF